MTNKYETLSRTILEAIGGKQNIVYFQHCTTRLRFNVKDRGLVDLKSIENADKVLGTQWSNDELQIIIGPAVADAYDAICELGNLEKEDAIEETIESDIKKKITVKSIIMGMLDAVSGSITPLIPMMIGGGMIKVFYMIANMAGILPESSSTYQILFWL